MTQAERRAARRRKRSHYQTADILESVQADIAEMRRQIASQRGTIDPRLVPDDVRRALKSEHATGWAFQKQPTTPVSLLEP